MLLNLVSYLLLCCYADLVSEGLVAGGTFVGEGSGVDASVHQVRDALTERLATRLTNERPLAGVYTLVVVQSGQLFERLPALSTHVRLGTRVVQQVLVERLLEREALAARRALVRPLARVQPHVLFLKK